MVVLGKMAFFTSGYLSEWLLCLAGFVEYVRPLLKYVRCPLCSAEYLFYKIVTFLNAKSKQKKKIGCLYRLISPSRGFSISLMLNIIFGWLMVRHTKIRYPHFLPQCVFLDLVTLYTVKYRGSAHFLQPPTINISQTWWLCKLYGKHPIWPDKRPRLG